ncbi:MAG: DNA methyltransferase [Candidatus Altiarchaeota archaeon]
MKYILRLSGEHPTLPKAELKAVLDGESLGYAIKEYGRILVLDVDSDDNSFLKRLAYTLSAAEFLGSSPTPSGLSGLVFDRISGAETFRVTGPDSVQQKLGGLLHGMGLRVDLKRPAANVFVFELEGTFAAGLEISVPRDYESRRPQYRPYFHPTSMHPKLARALVNLARVDEGDVVLDPFCGTGGVLIEAGLMGLGVIGWDVDPRMVEGCGQNLRKYGISGDLSVNSALEGSAGVDAIVTDPPYGRSSYASEDTQVLYGKFLENARTMLDVGSFMSIMLPDINEIVCNGFRMVENFDVRIHKSLTRRVWVLEAI